MTDRGRVGITQRQVHFSDRGETRDTLDARLARLVWDAGFAPVPLSNDVPDAEEHLRALGLDAVVLSGGDDVGSPPARDRVERAAISLAQDQCLPMLGICRGMQLLVVSLGGRLAPLDGHVRSRHVVEGVLTARREVNSFHSLGIVADALPDEFEVCARAADGSVEAVRHHELPWTGILWHPEREDPFDPLDIELVASALSAPV